MYNTHCQLPASALLDALLDDHWVVDDGVQLVLDHSCPVQLLTTSSSAFRFPRLA